MRGKGRVWWSCRGGRRIRGTHVKTHESGGGERYLASIGTSGDEWPPGIYTVFFHNWGYYDIGCETTSASVAYYW